MRPSTDWSRRELLGTAGAALAAGLAGCGDGGDDETESTPTGTPSLEDVKAALDPYRDVGEALADGYRNTYEFETDEEGGAGIPFVNPEIRSLNAYAPPILLYDLAESGQYELLGARWLRSAQGAEEPPELFGREFSEPRDGGSEEPPQYTLTAWLYTENPAGEFARYNPDVDPPSFMADVRAAIDALGGLGGAQAARAEGYESRGECEDGVGYRFVDESVAGVDHTEPPILRYEPGRDGTLQLAAAQWVVPAEDGDEPPTLFDQQFDGPVEAPGDASGERYELFAWLLATNPDGLFARANPRVDCQAG